MEGGEQVNIAPHTRCAAPGRFDCEWDDALYEITLEWGGYGDVESPVAWFCDIELDAANDDEAVNHYGARWLIVRQYSSGQVNVETFETKAFRDERLADLLAAFELWHDEINEVS